MSAVTNQSKPEDTMEGFKVINDSVHGHMEFHPLCIKVIDTPEFQRLRYIKQLGLTHLVYPSAAHSRFEHSLGVCHLAGLMIDELKKNIPSITKKEKLCVQMAGLCLNLGHGPFSLLWKKFLNITEEKWEREEQSIKMFDYLLEKNDLKKEFERHELHERERNFIKDLMLGEGEPLEANKHFLFQVVKNKINHIDVDKWDYYLRSAMHLNLKISFDYVRMMKFIRIMPVEEQGNKKVLVFKDKEAYSIYEMFNVRAKIHFAAARHRVVLVLNHMLLDALCAADDHFLGGLRLSQAHTDLPTWTKLTDSIFFDILNRTNNDRLVPSQRILNDMLKRHLYKFITYQEVTSVLVAHRHRVINLLKSELARQFPGFQLVVLHSCFRFTSAGENPFSKLYFYDKRNPKKLVKKSWNEIDLFRSTEDPDPKGHIKIFIFSKNLDLSDNDTELIRSVFQTILCKHSILSNSMNSNSL